MVCMGALRDGTATLQGPVSLEERSLSGGGGASLRDGMGLLPRTKQTPPHARLEAGPYGGAKERESTRRLTLSDTTN